MYKTVGMFAHVDAGKTTFAEQLLFQTQSIKQRGRVDHQDAFLDSHAIEKQRGITVFADQAIMRYKKSTYYLVDTPGHVDFSGEMERAIQVMDYAIVMMSAVEGIEGHTETIWQLLQQHRIPTLFFINKMDREGARVEDVTEAVRLQLTEDVYEMTNAFTGDRISEELKAFLAERDEALLEAFLEERRNDDFWLNAMRAMIKERRFFPCFQGSALQDIGITGFLESLDRLTETAYSEEGGFSGRVYKIRHDRQGTRETFIKALSGTLQVRDEIRYRNGKEAVHEKVTQIRVYNGRQVNTVNRVTAGQLFAVTGLSEAEAGDGLGMLEDKAVYERVPTLKSKVIVDAGVPIKEVLTIFRLLDAEEPSLRVVWDEPTQEIHIHLMGKIQLEVLQQLVQERFGLQVEFGNPEILYKETIAGEVMGYGHFEPLRHYAEVHLRLEPAERDSGITFESECHPDQLPVHYQNLVRQHIFERSHHGLLTGSPVTDMKITLTNGRAHNKHTSGGDFREATFRALRQGLEKSENMLLEPCYDFKVKVDVDHMGRVMSDIQQACGSFDPPEMLGGKAVITGKAPAATFMDYSTELAAFTQGKGNISLVFGGYDRCHNEDEVIERKAYDKNADPLYSSASIFCAKGHGYAVAWDEAERYMHLL